MVTKKLPRRKARRTRVRGAKHPIHPGYLTLIEAYPLRPIRSDRQLDEAIGVLDELQARSDPLEPEEMDYLECLSHEIERYEEESVPMPEVSGADMLRHLMEAREATLADVTEATGVVQSTLSSVLNGKRKLNLNHIKSLAPYFGVDPAVFLD